jgi:hypothetical protein
MSESGRARVERVETDVVGKVCFAAIARDLVPEQDLPGAPPVAPDMRIDVGKQSASGHKPVCVETVSSPFFYGCATNGRAPNHIGWVLSAFGAALVAWRRTRARARA